MMLKASSSVLATKSLPLLLNIPVETALIPNNADAPPKISVSVAPKGFPSNATCPVTSSILGLAPGIVTSASIPISFVTLSRFAISSGLNPKKDGVVFAMLYIIKSDTLSELAPVMSLTLRLGLFNSSSVNFLYPPIVIERGIYFTKVLANSPTPFGVNPSDLPIPSSKKSVTVLLRDSLGVINLPKGLPSFFSYIPVTLVASSVNNAPA